jgi:hypothetical protein
MKKVIAVLATVLVAAVCASAEINSIDITIFGMD